MMRTIERDISKKILIEMTAGNVASARGVSKTGVYWVMAKAANGSYDYILERGIVIIAVIPTASGGMMAAPSITGPNAFNLSTVTNAGVSADTQHQILVVAWDNR
jgi:hypothetical protein